MTCQGFQFLLNVARRPMMLRSQIVDHRLRPPRSQIMPTQRLLALKFRKTPKSTFPSMFRYLTILLSRNIWDSPTPKRNLHESQQSLSSSYSRVEMACESFHSFYALEPLEVIERQLTQQQSGAILKLHCLSSSSLSDWKLTDGTRRHKASGPRNSSLL
jgi:hypothetical protein